MFGEVISQIVRTMAPMNDEIALGDEIMHPVKTHIHGFGATLLDGIIGNASSTSVVSLNESWRLGVTHLEKSLAQNGGFLAVVG